MITVKVTRYDWQGKASVTIEKVSIERYYWMKGLMMQTVELV